MRVVLGIILILASMQNALAETKQMDLNEFAHNYYKTMMATQSPAATNKELEEYLALLADDVGYSHLPHVTDDSRLPDGKQSMRKGMTFYLGTHTEFNAELLDVFTFNRSAVAIRYTKQAKGIHPQSKQPHEYTSTMMEILEIEDGKVAVIRKYHE